MPEAIRDGLATLNDFDNPNYSGERLTQTVLFYSIDSETSGPIGRRLGQSEMLFLMRIGG